MTRETQERRERDQRFAQQEDHFEAIRELAIMHGCWLAIRNLEASPAKGAWFTLRHSACPAWSDNVEFAYLYQPSDRNDLISIWSALASLRRDGHQVEPAIHPQHAHKVAHLWSIFNDDQVQRVDCPDDDEPLACEELAISLARAAGVRCDDEGYLLTSLTPEMNALLARRAELRGSTC